LPPLKGPHWGQFEPTIITTSTAERKAQMQQDCGSGRLIKNCVATTHPLHSSDAHIRIYSGARGEVKPCILTINAVKKK
jgi:hypothetical protein